MAEVTELVTKFSFQGSTQPLTNFNKGLGDAIRGLTAMATATYGAIAGLTLWADRILKTVDPMAQLSRQTGIAVESIQELGFASSVNGGSLEAMSAGLERLNARIGEASALGTGEGVEIFKKLGVNIKDASGQAKSADVVFDELRQRIVALGLSQQEVGSFAEKLGLDPSAVQLLMKTNMEMSALRERARELGILTQEQTDATAEYNDSLTVLNRALGGLKQQIAVGFAPQMKNMVDGFTELLIVNRDWLDNGITQSIKAIVGFGKAITNVLGYLFDLIGALWEFKPIRYAIVALGLALGVAFAPITTIIVGMSALILLVDDLIMAFTGGKSVIGDFFMDFGINLNVVGDALGQIWDVLKAIISLDLSYLGELIGFGVDKLFGTVSPSQATGGTSSSVDNRQVNQNIQVEVRSNDPDSAGRAVVDNIQKQMNDANAQIGNGGL